MASKDSDKGSDKSVVDDKKKKSTAAVWNSYLKQYLFFYFDRG